MKDLGNRGGLRMEGNCIQDIMHERIKKKETFQRGAELKQYHRRARAYALGVIKDGEESILFEEGKILIHLCWSNWACGL